MTTNISNLTFDNLVRSLYNYIQEDATLKETFTEFTTAEATRLFAELFAYVGQQLSNRMNVVGNELFIDTASTKGLSRLLKLVGYKIPFANSSSVVMTANRNWGTEYLLSSGLKQLYTEGGSTKCHINPIPNFYQVKNNALTFEFISFNQTTNKYDYIEQVKLTKSSSEDEEKTVYQGVTNAKEITLTSVNGASFIINEQVCANSIEVFYKECEGSGSLLSDFKVIKFNEVDNIFSREAILGKDSEGNDVGYYTTRNLGQGKTEVYYKPNSNDLNKKIVIVWRTTAGASGNISAGSINETRRVAIGNITGTIHFTNKVAANYGTDELTDTDIRTYVTNEVRNLRVMVCPEDYEYIYKSNYPEIGFIRAFGESNTNFNALSQTYGYYVNPLNVWLLILKSNTVLSQAYANDVEGLTDIINGICFQYTDVNPRIDEKYQINPGIVNKEWIIGNLSNTNQYKYEFDISDSTAVDGSNIYVANTKFLQGCGTESFFNSSDMVYSNLEKADGTSQNYISPITGTDNSSSLYSQNERMITCPSWTGNKTFYSLKFKLNSGNNIDCAGAKSAQQFVDYINANSAATRTYNVVQLIGPSIQNLSNVLYTGSTANATMTITVNDSATTYTISLTNKMTYQGFIDALNVAFGNSGFIAFAYKEVNCYEILVRKDADPSAFSAQYDSTMATLIGKDASTTYNSEERVFYIVDGDPNNASRINASIVSGNIVIRVTGDAAHADQVTISGSSEDMAYFGFSTQSHIIKRYRTVALNKTTINTTTKFDITITTSGPQDALSNYNLYIDAFKTASQNNILLGSYYANMDESTTIGKLLKREAIKDLYPTTYIGDSKDAYNSEVFKLLMTLDSVGYATDVQVEDSDNTTFTYTIKGASTLLDAFVGKTIYIKNKENSLSYTIQAGDTIGDALSSFGGENGIIDYFSATGLVKSKLAGWDGGFCFKNTDPNILEFIFGSKETIYTVDGGLINVTQRPYIVLPVNSDKYVAGGSFNISVNGGTAKTVNCNASFEAMSNLPENVVKDNSKLVNTAIEGATNNSNVYSITLTFSGSTPDFSKWSDMFGGIEITVTGSGSSYTGTYTKAYTDYDYYIKHETNGYYLHPIKTFPIGDIYITSYEDYRHNHVYKDEGEGESVTKYFTDEYVYDSGLKDRKMMHITHQFKQPKFKPFDMKATITINNNIGLNKRETIKSDVLEYMRTTYGPYADTLGESVNRYDVKAGLMNIDGVKSVTIDYLGYELGTAADDYEELLCDFNQKLIPASTKKSGDVIIHGLDITVENEGTR